LLYYKFATIKTGFIAGLIGTLGDAIIHASAFYLFKTTMIAHYISQLIFPYQKVTVSKFILGEIAHFLAGGVVGILFLHMLKTTGKNLAYGKGIALSIFFWIVHVAIIPKMVETRVFLYRTKLEALVDFIGLLLYGVLTIFYLVRIVSPK